MGHYKKQSFNVTFKKNERKFLSRPELTSGESKDQEHGIRERNPPFSLSLLTPFRFVCIFFSSFSSDYYSAGFLADLDDEEKKTTPMSFSYFNGGWETRLNGWLGLPLFLLERPDFFSDDSCASVLLFLHWVQSFVKNLFDAALP